MGGLCFTVGKMFALGCFLPKRVTIVMLPAYSICILLFFFTSITSIWSGAGNFFNLKFHFLDLHFHETKSFHVETSSFLERKSFGESFVFFM